MVASSSQPTCLLVIGSDSSSQDWGKSFKTWLASAGIRASDYSAAAVDNASCILAFPQDDEKLFYQVAYGLGRGLKVLVVVEEDGVTPTTYEPPPTKIIQISLRSPSQIGETEEKITKILLEFTSSHISKLDQQQPDAQEKDSVRANAISAGLMLTTMDQAELQFQKFVGDGLSQEAIRKLLTNAGARKSWLDFRLQMHFGGW